MAITTTQIGDKFKNLCFIGLGRVEYFPEGAKEAITADSWQDVTDEQSRKSLALLFFSPRDLDGDHMNPYMYLADSHAGDEIDETTVMTSQQALQNIPLIDMCRVTKASANSVNILVVADVIFHWDVNDSYIQPTTPLTWINDLRQIQSTYPKSTKFNVYTDWNDDKLAEIRVKHKSIRELPLDTQTWLNMPTFQEKYAWPVLLLSLCVAGGAFAMNYYQEEEMDKLAQEIQFVETEAPNSSIYVELAKKVSEQEAFMRYRSIMHVAFRDIASSIYHADMEAEKFEIRGANPREPSAHLLATITARPDVYEGWLQEEPIAKKLLTQSVSMIAIRKPPKSKGFELEGLIDLEKLNRSFLDYRNSLGPAGEAAYEEETFAP